MLLQLNCFTLLIALYFLAYPLDGSAACLVPLVAAKGLKALLHSKSLII